MSEELGRSASVVTWGSRQDWVDLAVRLADPVLEAAAERKLRASMPVVTGPAGSSAERAPYAHLEAVGRLLCGLAPWLELHDRVGTDEERQQRQRLRDLAQEAIRSGVDPASPDRFTDVGSQPLVDAAFLALALKRAPSSLWWPLDHDTQARLVELLRSLRRIVPWFNNWLLFAAALEAWLRCAGESDWDRMRVDYALRQHEAWYLGDGVYADGPGFKLDHYNGFVIHPFLLDITDVVGGESKAWGRLARDIRTRAGRYAVHQERMVAPDGTYPAWGRSLTYRFGALHALGLVALRRELPDELSPPGVRGAMSAVIHRHVAAPATFDEGGWLTIGFAGQQPQLAESYISTGSLYLCATALVPLGLPPEDPFWCEPVAPWTSQRLWSGADLAADVHLEKQRPH